VMRHSMPSTTADLARSSCLRRELSARGQPERPPDSQSEIFNVMLTGADTIGEGATTAWGPGPCRAMCKANSAALRAKQHGAAAVLSHLLRPEGKQIRRRLRDAKRLARCETQMLNGSASSLPGNVRRSDALVVLERLGRNEGNDVQVLFGHIRIRQLLKQTRGLRALSFEASRSQARSLVRSKAQRIPNALLGHHDACFSQQKDHPVQVTRSVHRAALERHRLSLLVKRCATVPFWTVVRCPTSTACAHKYSYQSCQLRQAAPLRIIWHGTHDTRVPTLSCPGAARTKARFLGCAGTQDKLADAVTSWASRSPWQKRPATWHRSAG
jgi:hypothetical protein